MFTGLLDLSFWQYVLITLGLTHITIVGVTVFLHRHQAHRSLELHPVLSHFFRLWLWLTTGMVTKEWVAIHRKHHAKVDAEGDPHSPKVFGIKKVLLEGSELYRAEANNQETLDKYGHSTPDDKLEKWLYSRFPQAGITLMFAIDVILFGPIGITIWAIQMLWIPVNAAGVINGLGHYLGYRNYETPDTSTNVVPFGILIGGEELHNNHHAFASSARFSSRWWEFDLGWHYIRLFSWLGLARVKKIMSKPVFDTSKLAIDTDALMAIITHRFQVMSRYGREVLGRVYKDEKRNADRSSRSVLRRGRKLLVRETTMMDEQSKHKLQNILSINETLNVVYHYKEQLQDIWQRTTASQEQLLKDLQEWCRQAEATGIMALEEFARNLRGYSLQPVRV